MFPDFPAKTLFEYYGFQGDLVNHNCFLDENLFHIKSSEKKYDAIYTARLSPFKRHHLASKIGNLALVAGNTSTKLIEELPPHSFINDKHLLPEQVIDIISESKVGIILSDFEGACYSSSEYLLCGIPVVSTRSHGGRDVWYNSYNSIICDPTPESVADAVKKLASLKRKPEEIRSMHIHQSQYFQQNFINLFQKSLTLGSDHIDAKEYFKDNYKHKLLPSTTPEFDALFN
jgi:glycosyltransferase involved in cell wall biosynthesis